MEKKQYIHSIIKKVNDRTFKVIASTGIKDREGELVNPKGWEIANYKRNPVILWAHDINALPIGKATDVVIDDDELVITGEFASKEANPRAEEVRLLFEAGIQKAVSVGFIPLERDNEKIMKQELLELSFVPVPANPEALAKIMQKKLHLDLIEPPSKEDKELAEQLLKNSAKESSPYDKKSFLKIMSRKKRKQEEAPAEEAVEVVAKEGLEDVAVELKEVVLEELEKAIPELEEATEKQLEGEPVVTELKTAIEEIIDKNLEAEAEPIAEEVTEIVEAAPEPEDGEKQEMPEEVMKEAEVVVEESLQGVATDIVEEINKELEASASEIVEAVEDEAKRKQAEETVAEVIATLEKDIEAATEEVMEKNVEPLTEDLVEVAEEEVEAEAKKKQEDEEDEEDEEEKGGHEDEEDEDKQDEEDEEDEDKPKRRRKR